MIEIIDYEDRYASDFKQLNVEWLEKYNVIEDYDLQILDHPKEKILNDGGYIFLAKINDEIVGTAGLKKEDKKTYELVKMAVTAEFQGKGISRILMDKCIDTAKLLYAKKIVLYSNHQLQTAINLYKKYGFKHVSAHDSPLLTADIKMELSL
ncbi:MAG: GNAT family N-acetyltransferase [Chitinophagaceae bacterium]